MKFDLEIQSTEYEACNHGLDISLSYLGWRGIHSDAGIVPIFYGKEKLSIKVKASN